MAAEVILFLLPAMALVESVDHLGGFSGGAVGAVGFRTRSVTTSGNPGEIWCLNKVKQSFWDDFEDILAKPDLNVKVQGM